MNNFYQSQVWININKYVFEKPNFEIDILGKKYFGTIKEKKKFGISLRWYQIIGIESGIDFFSNSDYVNDQLSKIVRDFKRGIGDIMFQLGFIDIIENFKINELKNIDYIEYIKNKRIAYENSIKNKFNIFPSFRENMPQATIVFDLEKSYNELYSEMSKSARAHIKKGLTRELYFDIAKENDWDDFYEIWLQTAKDKKFNIIPKKTFYELKNYLLNYDCGKLFLAKKKSSIVSGSICIIDKSNIIYLYGATNRDFGNVGGHHFLKNEIFKRGIQNDFKQIDLLGASPTGINNHHLEGVTNFKQSLGGTKIEYVGNYDIIFNSNLYEMYKLIKS